VAPCGWTWNEETITLVVLLLAAYPPFARQFRARRWQIGCFAVAVALILAFGITPLHAISVHYLLWIHLLQNVVLAEWAPLLLVLSLPTAMAAALTHTRSTRVLTHPAVALPLWLANSAFWPVPTIDDAAERREHTLLHLEHLTYLLTGVLVWWPVLQDVPRRLGAGARTLYVFAAFVLAAPLGLVLALVQSPIYSVYEHAPSRLWGLSALSDQQLGGITMASEQALVFFVFFVFWFLRFLAEQEHAPGDPGREEAVDPRL
jgi:cytochrome c oxidase assembly factor CtaG